MNSFGQNHLQLTVHVHCTSNMSESSNYAPFLSELQDQGQTFKAKATMFKAKARKFGLTAKA